MIMSGRIGQRLDNRLAAVAGLFHLVPVAFQEHAQQIEVFFDIIYDQYPFHGFSLSG